MATIYDEIGGKDGVAAAVDRFYGHVMDDEVLAHYFAGIDLRRQKAHLRAFLATRSAARSATPAATCAARTPGSASPTRRSTTSSGHLVTTLTGLGVAPKTIGAIGGRVAPLQVADRRGLRDPAPGWAAT